MEEVNCFNHTHPHKHIYCADWALRLSKLSAWFLSDRPTSYNSTINSVLFLGCEKQVIEITECLIQETGRTEGNKHMIKIINLGVCVCVCHCLSTSPRSANHYSCGTQHSMMSESEYWPGGQQTIYLVHRDKMLLGTRNPPTVLFEIFKVLINPMWTQNAAFMIQTFQIGPCLLVNTSKDQTHFLVLVQIKIFFHISTLT